MSKTTIPDKVKLRLWLQAGGRCEYKGCNDYLYEDSLTYATMNRSYIAHIISDSPNGPRGHPTLSEELSQYFDNLMLLCDTHHRLIDIEKVEEHPVKLLKAFKKEHEDRIKLLTSINPSHKTHIIKFCTNINTRKGLCNFQQACEAILPRYPSEDSSEINLTNLSLNENDLHFWEVAKTEIKRQIEQIFSQKLNKERPEHLSIFALAPIPLLIFLGKEIGDTTPYGVYQKHRDTNNWVWAEQQKDLDFCYEVTKPEKYDSTAKQVILNLSLSGEIHQPEIDKAIKDCPVYKITIKNPNRDFLKYKEQLALFKKEFHQLLALIRERHGSDAEIHLFPAIPVSIAVECGCVLLPKSDPKLIIYDNNKTLGGFKYALTIE
ncbi:MAG TPA: SAVED domain-containing protein [Thiotrichaceae bacterium]|nr:SAVED domain-containing protein [Thiotrichaceae bacterium]